MKICMNPISLEIILALDLEDRKQIHHVLNRTENRLKWVKVGLQSYLRDGASLVNELADSGKKVFLDLKLHDIPNTMEKALGSLVNLPVSMITCTALLDRRLWNDVLSLPNRICPVSPYLE